MLRFGSRRPRQPALAAEDRPKLRLVEELPFPERRLQVAEPRRTRVKLGEERSLAPVRIAGLYERQHEALMPANLRDALDSYLPGKRGHDGAAGVAPQSRLLRHRLPVDLKGTRELHL